MKQGLIEFAVDGVPYEVKVEPYEYNTETRYKISYGDSPEYIFTWDSELGRLAAIDDDSSTLPDDVEVAIAERLQAGKY